MSSNQPPKACHVAIPSYQCCYQTTWTGKHPMSQSTILTSAYTPAQSWHLHVHSWVIHKITNNQEKSVLLSRIRQGVEQTTFNCNQLRPKIVRPRRVPEQITRHNNLWQARQHESISGLGSVDTAHWQAVSPIRMTLLITEDRVDQWVITLVCPPKNRLIVEGVITDVAASRQQISVRLLRDCISSLSFLNPYMTSCVLFVPAIPTNRESDWHHYSRYWDQ